MAVLCAYVPLALHSLLSRAIIAPSSHPGATKKNRRTELINQHFTVLRPTASGAVPRLPAVQGVDSQTQENRFARANFTTIGLNQKTDIICHTNANKRLFGVYFPPTINLFLFLPVKRVYDQIRLWQNSLAPTGALQIKFACCAFKITSHHMRPARHSSSGATPVSFAA